MWSTLGEIKWSHTPIMIAYRGSHSHGTYMPSTDPNSIDDIDLMAIEMPPLSCYFGLNTWEGRDFWHNEYDIVEYSTKKFLGLLTKCNPNVMGMLWLRPEDYLYQSYWFGRIMTNRELFLAKKPMRGSFMGYVNGQVKRMTSGKAFQGYMGQKRRSLVEKYGYDTKNAAHAVRLMFTYRDFLRHKEIRVWREEHQHLIDIKSGGFSLNYIEKEIKWLSDECEELYDQCDVPEQNDRQAISKFMTELHREYYER